ncbi:MAG: cyclic pyranopterin monophosphate synthase MoaC [Pseudomonadota bacterium]
MTAGALSHFDADGRPRMVDVSDKEPSARRAVARGRVDFSPEAFATIREHGVAKGDLAAIAELAGVTGAKRTADLIPLCHPLALSGVDVTVRPAEDAPAFVVTASVKTTGRTGVEMEAMTAVAVACLTVYDMAKAIDKGITISQIALLEKSGGKSGDYIRAE